jgi:hypothetical protein
MIMFAIVSAATCLRTHQRCIAAASIDNALHQYSLYLTLHPNCKAACSVARKSTRGLLMPPLLTAKLCAAEYRSIDAL